eukprot:scaffold22742_cov139-Cylindrotheca_fusiformis.AAC.12
MFGSYLKEGDTTVVEYIEGEDHELSEAIDTFGEKIFPLKEATKEDSQSIHLSRRDEHDDFPISRCSIDYPFDFVLSLLHVLLAIGTLPEKP